MKKQKTQLIVILVVLAVLVASYFALSAHNKKVEEDEATDDYTILTMDTTTVTQIKVTKTTKTEVVVETAEAIEGSSSDAATEEVSSDAAEEAATEEASVAEPVYEYTSEVLYDLVLEDGTWYLSSDKSLAIDQDTVTTLLSNLETVTSNKEIQNVTDFAQYGLDHPSLDIEVSLTGGTTTTIHIGDYNSISSLYYVRIGDSANVYMITSTLNSAFNVDSSSFEQVDSSESTSETSTGITGVDIDASVASSAAAAVTEASTEAEATTEDSADAEAGTEASVADTTDDASEEASVTE